MLRRLAILALAAGCVPVTFVDLTGKACGPGGVCGQGFACSDAGVCESTDAGVATTTAGTAASTSGQATSEGSSSNSSGAGSTGTGTTESSTASSTTGTTTTTTGSAASTTGSTTVAATSSGTTSGGTTSGGTTGGSTTGGGTAGGGDAGAALVLIAGQLGGCGTVDGVGATARFDTPDQIVADGQGHLYLADTDSFTIREIDVSTSVVTTLAGAPYTPEVNGIGGAAGLSYPAGIAFDGAGHLFVADAFGEVIREIDLTSLFVSTLAGTAFTIGSSDGLGPAASFSSPAGLTWDPFLNVLFVADFGNDAIREVDPTSGNVTTVAGSPGDAGAANGIGSAALFNGPTGIAADGQGHLLVFDALNFTLREIDETGWSVTTPLGTVGAHGLVNGQGNQALFQPFVQTDTFSFSTGLAFDDGGTLYVGDTSNNVIRSASSSSWQTATLAGTGVAAELDGPDDQAEFTAPNGVSWDGLGNLYVADACTVRQIALASAAVSTVAGAAVHPGSTDGPGSAASFNSPTQIASDGQHTLYVADSQNFTIRVVDTADRTVSTLAGLAGSPGTANGIGAAARFISPAALALPAAGQPFAGQLFVVDGATIRQIDLDAGAVSTLVAADAGFGGGIGVAADSAGNLYVADTARETIDEIDIAAATVTVIAGTPGQTGNANGVGPAARFSNPRAVALDDSGNLFMSDDYNYSVREIALASANVTTLAGNGYGCQDGMGGSMRYPAGLIWDGAGSLYLADQGCSSIRKIDLASGALTTVVGATNQFGVQPGPLPARLSSPFGLAMDGSGHLFLSDFYENAVLEVTALP